MKNYAYRQWDDPYFWQWYTLVDKVFKFIKSADGRVIFERIA